MYEDAAFPGMAKAAVAQLVEQRIRNAWVGGSSPFRGTKFFRAAHRHAKAEARAGEGPSGRGPSRQENRGTYA